MKRKYIFCRGDFNAYDNYILHFCSFPLQNVEWLKSKTYKHKNVKKQYDAHKNIFNFIFYGSPVVGLHARNSHSVRTIAGQPCKYITMHRCGIANCGNSWFMQNDLWLLQVRCGKCNIWSRGETTRTLLIIYRRVWLSGQASKWSVFSPERASVIQQFASSLSKDGFLKQQKFKLETMFLRVRFGKNASGEYLKRQFHPGSRDWFTIKYVYICCLLLTSITLLRVDGFSKSNFLKNMPSWSKPKISWL